jgi:hypothetical protein
MNCQWRWQPLKHIPRCIGCGITVGGVSENVPDGPVVNGQPSLQWRKTNWDRELAVVEKILDADARNCGWNFILLIMFLTFLKQVHAWNYRRYIMASMPVQRPGIAELAYTTRKISASFSNFSAWHQRSKVFSSLWNTDQLDPVQSREEGESLPKFHLFTMFTYHTKNLILCTMPCLLIQTTKVLGSITGG